MSFKFQARYVLLTYAQCGDLDPWVVSDHLSSLGAECIIGRENHSDGGIHLHAFVDFGKRFSTRNVQKFDVGGCHPNIEPSKGRPWAGYDYAIKDGDRKKSLVLYGPSRMGKTLWARSLGNHAYFGGLFSMDEPLDDVAYAVFDDFGGLKFLPTYKFWLGHQKEFYVTDKYKGKQLVVWGKPSIWLNNVDPREEHGIRDDEIEWLNANCDFIKLDRELISHASTEQNLHQ
ncbi:Rep [Bat associated gemykibivirus 1]|nr:Rep [Bat associated gemykibivirus 1]